MQLDELRTTLLQICDEFHSTHPKSTLEDKSEARHDLRLVFKSKPFGRMRYATLTILGPRFEVSSVRLAEHYEISRVDYEDVDIIEAAQDNLHLVRSFLFSPTTEQVYVGRDGSERGRSLTIHATSSNEVDVTIHSSFRTQTMARALRWRSHIVTDPSLPVGESR